MSGYVCVSKAMHVPACVCVVYSGVCVCLCMWHVCIHMYEVCPGASVWATKRACMYICVHLCACALDAHVCAAGRTGCIEREHCVLAYVLIIFQII